MTAESSTVGVRAIDPEELFTKRHDRIPVITIEQAGGRVLGLNLTNRAAFETTVLTGRCHYYDDVNDAIFLKGEHSGEIEHVLEIRLDCCHARRHELHLLYLVRMEQGQCMFGVDGCHFYRFDGKQFVFDRSMVTDDAAMTQHWNRIQTVLETAEDRIHQGRFGKK